MGLGITRVLDALIHNHFCRKVPKGTLALRKDWRTGRWFNADLNHLKERFGAERLFLVHGLAYERGGQATVVCGPPGTGKTSAFRELLQRDGSVKPIDDAFVFLLEKAGKLQVLETGTYYFTSKVAFYSKKLKGLLPFGCIYLENNLSGFDLTLRDAALHVVQVLAHALAKFSLPDRSRETFKPRPIPLSKFYDAVHPMDPFKPRECFADRQTFYEYDNFARMLGEQASFVKLGIGEIRKAF